MPLNNADFVNIVNTVRAQAPKLEPESKKFNDAAEPKKPKRNYTKAERERRAAKKESYLEYKKQMDELNSKYRDRATERRKEEATLKSDSLPNNTPGTNSTISQTPGRKTQEELRAIALQAKTRITGNANNFKNPLLPGQNNQNNFLTANKKAIQDSKFLGGDIEHTHLVKGLDYALLAKKRQEMAEEEKEKEEEMAKLVDKQRELREKMGFDKSRIEYKTQIGRRIGEAALKIDAESKNNDPANYPKYNKIFLPGRMAFVFDTSKKGATVPSSITRSEIEVSSADRLAADAFLKSQSESGESTHNIVVNKLVQILSYIKAGETAKLNKKRKNLELEAKYEKKELEIRKRLEEKMKQKRREQEERIKYEKEREKRKRRHEERYRGDDRYQEDRRREKDQDRNLDIRRDRSRRIKKEKSPTPEPENDADSDDIFADVGSNYVCDTKKKKTAAKPDKAHFNTKDIEDSLPQAPKKLTSKLTERENLTDSIIRLNTEMMERRGEIETSKTRKLEELNQENNENESDRNRMTKDVETYRDMETMMAEHKAQKAKARQKNNSGQNIILMNTYDPSKKSSKLPKGAMGFGAVKAGNNYGMEFDDDDRFDDPSDKEFNKKFKSNAHENSYAQQQWDKVHGIIERNKKVGRGDRLDRPDIFINPKRF